MLEMLRYLCSFCDRTYGAVALLVIAPGAFGGGFTYRVTEHPEACHEVHIPRWTVPPEMKKHERSLYLPATPMTGQCRYDLRTPGGMELFVSVYCLNNDPRSPSWRIAEKYDVDLSRPKSVQQIEETEWESARQTMERNQAKITATSVNPGTRSNPRLQGGGVEFAGRFFQRSGPEWPPETGYEQFASGGHILLNSWGGVIRYGDFFGAVFKGQYWTDIFDVASGRRLIQVYGAFHGVNPYDFQLQGSMLDRFYVLPLQPTGMRRFLVCDLDAPESKPRSGRVEEGR